MITLKNINKFYNKGKPNEIHVINNTSLVFEKQGLVAITGPSGCGKTTILNIVGGLDKFESGEINFDGESIHTYNASRWDILRNKYVGYIFQNYNLIADKTVYENIEITLNMAGLYDKDEVEERIHYVLKSVGLYNYRRRNVLALSGGQQQRVAIARALAKNPKVILADEPTGNLDANNTFEVMRLIKKISKTCLVVLVSHEKELVSFYADRVIELSDGVVLKDYRNEGTKMLSRIDDRKIYLKDLKQQTQSGLVDVSSYYLEAPATKPEIKLVHLNNTLYVKVDAATRIKYISDDNDIHLIDDHYKEETSTDAEKHLFDMSPFGHVAMHAKRKSFIRFRDTLRSGFAKMIGGQKLFGKLFILAFFVISMIAVNNIATFASLTRVDETTFVSMPRNAVSIEIGENLTYNSLASIMALDSEPFISTYTRNMTMYFSYEDLYQASGLYRGANARINCFPVPLSYLDDHTIFMGRLPENNGEMAIDLWVANSILQSKEVSDIGIKTYEEILEGELLSINREYGNLKIVGIVETNSPIVVITDDNIFYFAQADVGAYGSIRDIPTMVEGTWEVGNNEVLVNQDTGYSLGDPVLFNNKIFTVVGIYTDASYIFVLSNAMYHEASLRGLLQTQLGYNFYILTQNKEKTIEEINGLFIEAIDTYQSAYDNFVSNQRLAIAGRVRNIIMTLGGILVYIFLMMRSSMLGRIREIGIYRSIGATKQDIYKIFISEIIAFTTLGGLTGYLLMSYIVNQIQNAIGSLFSIYYFPFYLFISGIIVIYAINLVFGMIPIFTLLRKTPSDIMAKYDI